jgi:hypothetical protein
MIGPTMTRIYEGSSSHLFTQTRNDATFSFQEEKKPSGVADKILEDPSTN